jgi:hypothetical protein
MKTCTLMLYYSKLKKESYLHAMQALRGETYSAYSFFTSALDRVSGQRHASAGLYHPVPI